MEQSFSEGDKFLGKLDLVETKIQELESSDALRIFQVDD